MVIAIALVLCSGVYAGEQSVPIWTDSSPTPASVVSVPIWTDSRDSNNVVSVPIWTDEVQPPSTTVSISVYHDPQPSTSGYSIPAYSNPAYPNSAYSNSYTNPAYPNPAYSNPAYANPAYSNPAQSNSYSNPAYSNPESSGYSNPNVPMPHSPTAAYSPPALLAPTPAYSSVYPNPITTPIPIKPPARPPSSPVIVQVPVPIPSIVPIQIPSIVPVPVQIPSIVPVQIPSIVPVPVANPIPVTVVTVPVPLPLAPSRPFPLTPTPGFVVFPPQAPTPALFPFPDPPTTRPTESTIGPRPAAPTNQRPTRVPPQAPSPAISPVDTFPQLHAITPASVCSTVRRNLKISGSGSLNPTANFSCLVIPSCEDNLLWKDRNGHTCQEYLGMICDAEANANCRKSCKASCPRVACQDRDEFFAQCASLKDQGRCVTDSNRMMVQCPVTCDFCGMFPAFVISDSQLACQAPPLGGQGSVTLNILRDQILVGGFQVQSYECQNNETSDPTAVSIKDLAGMVARPVGGGFNPTDSKMDMQFYVENIGLLNLSGPIMLYTVSGGASLGRRLLDANAAQAIWCAPDLSVGMIVLCSIVRYISPEEQTAQSLTTSVWAQASFQGAVVNSTVYTFKTAANTAPPTSSSIPFINPPPARTVLSPSETCSWRDSASCWPWWAWLILALLLLLLILCCVSIFCACKGDRNTTKKKNTTNYVYRRPRPQASPPVAHASPSPHLSQETAHGPAEASEKETRVVYHTMGDNGSLENPAVRLVFNTNSAPPPGTFEVRGADPEVPSHFVFEERGSANSLSHSPTAGRRSISYSQQTRRDHVLFNEST